jgi:hypothetical protein
MQRVAMPGHLKIGHLTTMVGHALLRRRTRPSRARDRGRAGRHVRTPSSPWQSNAAPKSAAGLVRNKIATDGRCRPRGGRILTCECQRPDACYLWCPCRRNQGCNGPATRTAAGETLADTLITIGKTAGLVNTVTTLVAIVRGPYQRRRNSQCAS